MKILIWCNYGDYQFIDMMGFNPYYAENSCDYITKFFFATFVFSALSLMVGFGSASLTFGFIFTGIILVVSGPVSPNYIMDMAHMVLPEGLMLTYAMFVGIIFVTLLFSTAVFIVNSVEKYKEWKREKLYNSSYVEPSAVRKLYNSWRDKYCVPIEIKSE